MKNILFPTDFSEAANRAFIYALHFARKFDAKVTTLHVYQRPRISAMHMAKTLEEFYETFDLEEFENYRDSIPPLKKIAEDEGFGDLEIYHALEGGDDINSTILKVAHRDKADLMVMGTTGARGLKRIFLGSVAAYVLEKAPCPVLVVPEEAEFDGVIDRVAFTTSFSPLEKEALGRIEEMLKPFHPEVNCVNVDTAHTHSLDQKMEEFSSDFGARENLKFEVLEGNDIFAELTKYLSQNQMDIIAMVTHKRKFVQKFFDYSKTKKMTYHAQTPVLAIPADILQGAGA